MTAKHTKRRERKKNLSRLFASFAVKSLALFGGFGKNCNVQENTQEVLKEFGKRIQRCYGCFIAYLMKDMYLGEDVTFFCDYCKDETMFHFDDFSKMLDISKLKEVADEQHH